jgi:predicted AAA+ superfamily ATPase
VSLAAMVVPRSRVETSSAPTTVVLAGPRRVGRSGPGVTADV